MGIRSKPRSFSTNDPMWQTVVDTASREGISQSSVVNRALDHYFSSRVNRPSAWETTSEDQWYDERHFYTASEDRHHHSTTIYLHVPKNMRAAIGVVVGSGAIPEYRSAQDFYRDAIFHRAHRVAKWIEDDSLSREVHLQMLLSDQQVIAQERQDAKELLASTRQNIEDAMGHQEYLRVAEWLKAAAEQISSLPEPYQGEYGEMVGFYWDRLATMVPPEQQKMIAKVRKGWERGLVLVSEIKTSGSGNESGNESGNGLGDNPIGDLAANFVPIPKPKKKVPKPLSGPPSKPRQVSTGGT